MVILPEKLITLDYGNLTNTKLSMSLQPINNPIEYPQLGHVNIRKTFLSNQKKTLWNPSIFRTIRNKN